MKNKEVLQEIINARNICFLSSINEEGFPVTRAMLKPIKMEDGFFYLHTNTSSKKVQQFINNDKACLYFCNEQTFQGITLFGDIEILTDDKVKQEFWKNEYRIYYSKGKGLSDFTILKFHAVDGEYYNNFTVKKL